MKVYLFFVSFKGEHDDDMARKKNVISNKNTR